MLLQKQKKYKKVSKIFLILTVLSVLVPIISITVQAEPRSIRVGYFDYGGFIGQDAHGNYKGYGVDYLNRIAKYTDWEYEYVYDTWQNLLERLKSGEIDLLCTAQYTEEREKYYDFSKYSIGIEASVIYVRPNDERYYFEDFEAFDGMKVGALLSSFQNDVFKDYAKRNGFTYQSFEFATNEDAFKALDQGEVDAVLMGSLSLQEGYKTVGQYSADAFYFMTSEGNDEIIEPLNQALDIIKSSDLYYEAELYDKHYRAEQTSTPNYTRAEIEYIHNLQEITVGIISDRAPLSSMDSQEFQGMVVDLSNYISDLSGIQFNYVEIPVSGNYKSILEDGTCDVIAGFMCNLENDESRELNVSDQGLTSNLVVATKKGRVYYPVGSWNIAITPYYSGFLDDFQVTYPNANIMVMDTKEECAKAVLSGKADMMIENKYILSLLIENPHYSELDILPTFFMEEEVGFATLKNVNPLLISIINKSIDVISNNVKDEIVISNTVARPYEFDFGDMVYKYRYFMIPAMMLIVMCFALLITIMTMRHRSFKRLTFQNELLQKAKKSAESASAAKSIFLARISHELRTPMNAIIGMTNIAQNNTKSPDKMNECLKKIDNSSHLLLSIINDVLDMSAIENEKMKIAYTPFSLKQLISNITTLYYVQCKNKGIRLEISLINVTEENLIGDLLRVNQILLNLISNAFKFTEPGGTIKLVVLQRKVTDNQVYLRFLVQDNGCGMSEEMKKRLFQPFEQENASIALKHGGSGLGLSIAKNLVDLMKGTIDVQSALGKGTTFMVDIPFGRDPQNQNKQSKLFSDRIVMITDFNGCNAQYLCNILNGYQMVSERAKSYSEIIECLERNRERMKKTMILLDWDIIDSNPEQLVNDIRKDYDCDEVSIVACVFDKSVLENEDVLRKVNQIITKPIFPSCFTKLFSEKKIEKRSNR